MIRHFCLLYVMMFLMSAHTQETSTSTWAKYLEAKKLNEIGIPVKTACNHAGLSRPMFYVLKGQEAEKKKGGEPASSPAQTSSTPEGESDAVLNSIIADSPSMTRQERKK